jgi:hypothetical protein
MTKEFNEWWDANAFSTDNPYNQNTPACWAWEGWQAAIKAEREACAKLIEDYERFGDTRDCAEAIRARGQA